MKKIALFDLDGVLIDSIECMKKSWDETREIFNLPDFSKFIPQIGKPFPNILSSLGISQNINEISTDYFHRTKSNSDLVIPYNNIIFSLNRLRSLNFSIGIVTSKARANSIHLIDKFQIPCDKIICGDDVVIGKPSPEPINAILREFKASTNSAFYVGDMEVDFLSATAANVDFFFANWGYGQIKNIKNAVILNSPTDLFKYL